MDADAVQTSRLADALPHAMKPYEALSPARPREDPGRFVTALEDPFQDVPAEVLPSSASPRPRTIPIGLRYLVLKRDRFRCALCGSSPALDPTCQLHLDHILPFSAGGKSELANLRSLCAPCNLGKGGALEDGAV
jgi:hypothetical protein